jgi:hypothetical protein
MDPDFRCPQSSRGIHLDFAGKRYDVLEVRDIRKKTLLECVVPEGNSRRGKTFDISLILQIIVSFVHHGSSYQPEPETLCHFMNEYPEVSKKLAHI